LGRPLVESLKDALVRAYGEHMYERIVASAQADEGTHQ